jgi:hypothetical protein
VQAADEARHIEVFTRRATRGRALGLSTQGGQASLKTLDERLRDRVLPARRDGRRPSSRCCASRRPRPARSGHRARGRARRAGRARHVAFAVGHLRRHAQHDATLLARLAAAVGERHAALLEMSGRNEELFDALVVIAAGRLEPRAIGAGFDAVQRLLGQMDAVRRQCLEAIGFPPDDAARLSGLHTRNFM